MKRLLPWIGSGIALGALFSLSPGSVFIASVAAGISFAILRWAAPSDRRYLLVLFLTAFLLRAGASAGLDLLSWKAAGELPYRDGEVRDWNLHISDKTRGYLKMGDSDYFSQRGYATAQFVEGVNEPVLSFRVNQYGKHGYIYCIGWFYYLFGFSPCAVKLINALLGSLMAVWVFFLGQRCFGTRAGRWAGALTALFPSLILWSATNLKDIPLTFFTLFTLFLYSRLLQTKGWRSRLALFLLLLLSLRTHMTFRSVELSILLAALLVTAWLLARFARAYPAATLFGLAVLPVLGVALSFGEPAGHRVRQVLGQLFNWHIGFFSTPGSSYNFLPDFLYKGRNLQVWIENGSMNWTILLGMARAVLHYLFEPFPWHISNTFQWITYPQIILWYALLPFSLIGLAAAAREKQETSIALASTAVLFAVIGALANGNIGTVFRQRDMVTPLFLILACGGLYRIVGDRPYAQGSLLLSGFSRFARRRLSSVGQAARRTGQELWEGPWGISLRARPLRSVGILGVSALMTRGALAPFLGRPATIWEGNAGLALGGLCLLALLYRGDWEQLTQGSRILRFLKQP